MCGIAGVIHTNRFNKNDVTKMIECISYRGPDEQDVVKVGPCYLVMCVWLWLIQKMEITNVKY